MGIDYVCHTAAPRGGTACDRLVRAMLQALQSLVPEIADYRAVDRWTDAEVDGPTLRVVIEPVDVITREDGSAYAGTLDVSVILRAPAGSASCDDWDLERSALETALHDSPGLVTAMIVEDGGIPLPTRWISSTESAAGADGDIMTCIYSGSLIVPAPLGMEG